jgi:predicted nucleic acid-binding protein
LEAIQKALGEGLLRVKAPTSRAVPMPGTAELGLGEIEALLLAEELRADLLVTDDAAARREGLRRGLEVTGTLGLLTSARERGQIPAVLPFLLELRALGQWISDELVEVVRQEDEGAARRRA